MAKTRDLAGIVDTRREGTRSMTSLGFVNTRTLLDTSTRHVEKDRGNPGVLKVYPYPHPLKTPTLVKGRGF